jgi:hypothetical protein
MSDPQGQGEAVGRTCVLRERGSHRFIKTHGETQQESDHMGNEVMSEMTLGQKMPEKVSAWRMKISAQRHKFVNISVNIGLNELVRKISDRS